jgi:hypothetical protein
MDKQVLVAYATKYGATAEIAEKIGEVLREAGLQVEVRPADRAGDVGAYQAVVLGRAVYIGAWRTEAAHERRGSGGTDAGLALPGEAAAGRRSHRAPGRRPLSRRGELGQDELYREIRAKEHESGPRRLPGLGGHLGLGHRHRRSAESIGLGAGGAICWRPRQASLALRSAPRPRLLVGCSLGAAGRPAIWPAGTGRALPENRSETSSPNETVNKDQRGNDRYHPGPGWTLAHGLSEILQGTHLPVA